MAQINKPDLYFNTKLYTGDGASSRAITGIGFEPSLTWNKPRTTANDHQLVDAVRGGGKVISSNLADAEYTAGNTILSFNSDGFTCGDGASVNANGVNYASWNWLANGAGSANTDGSISSTVSANTTSGFSIVKYVGTGANATVGHGLGSKVDFAIFKITSGANAWLVYHKSLGATKAIYLNQTGAVGTNSSGFNNTEPTSSVFSLGSGTIPNTSGGTQIAYCFAEKQGYSKFGSYTGNGNDDGTFVYTGFKPAFIMIKRTDSTSNWTMFDNKRDGFNCDQAQLKPNTSDAENAGSASTFLDILSNGFKCRNTATDKNDTGGSYIYMAFAEQPLVGTNNIPATAR